MITFVCPLDPGQPGSRLARCSHGPSAAMPSAVSALNTNKVTVAGGFERTGETCVSASCTRVSDFAFGRAADCGRLSVGIRAHEFAVAFEIARCRRDAPARFPTWCSRTRPRGRPGAIAQLFGGWRRLVVGCIDRLERALHHVIRSRGATCCQTRVARKRKSFCSAHVRDLLDRTDQRTGHGREARVPPSSAACGAQACWRAACPICRWPPLSHLSLRLRQRFA